MRFAVCDFKMSNHSSPETDNSPMKLDLKHIERPTYISQDEIQLKVRKISLKKEANNWTHKEIVRKSLSDAECEEDMVELVREELYLRKGSQISLHGVSHLAYAKDTSKRISWLLVISIFWAFLTYMLVSVFVSYAAHDVYTVREKVQVNEMVFPAISFCSTPKLDEIFLRYNVSYQNHNDVTALPVLHRFVGDYISNRSTKNRLSVLKTMFVEGIGACQFGNKPCSFERDFKAISEFHFDGVCFTFNPSGTFSQQGEGSKFGLSVIVFVNNTEETVDMAVRPGLSLVINSHDVFPFPLINGILVSPGELTLIRLQKQRMTRLPAPFPRKCADNGPILFPGKYTPNNCKQSCYIQKALDACEASVFPVNKEKQNCFYSKLVEENLAHHPHACACPLPCKEDRFIPLATQSDWPNEADLPYLKKLFATAIGKNSSTLSNEYVKKNFLRVNIFFHELAYEKVDDVAVWTQQKLVSDIGGQMGIWVGASLFTVMEMMAYMASKIKSFLYLLCHRS
ncbi:acid-sensing ion channel 4-A-like [Rhopilema esculentum]|uniref:acid-sensing ion channel 4-A-like n=1 Tax=Rhopilema esculentum TaxID=499914 RepID=UPI0031CF1EB9